MRQTAVLRSCTTKLKSNALSERKMNQTVVHNSNSILLLREGGVVEDRGGRKNNVYTYFFVNDRIMYSPTTSPYGYSSFPKEEN